MTMSPLTVSFFANFSSKGVLRWTFAAALFGAVAAPGPANAGGYDGIWNVLIITQAGNCDPAYSYPFRVSGRRISTAGAADVSGSVGGGGSVAVRISAGGSVATGSGRLSGSTGAGRWSAKLSGGNCSGHWQATRG